MTRPLPVLTALLPLLAAGCGDKETPDDSTPTDDSATGAYVPECVDGVATLSGEYTQAEVHLVSGCLYLLSGAVFIGDDSSSSVLRIDPGVTVYGDNSTLSFLVIRRGAQLLAEGTADAPIVFTSPLPVGQRGRSDWGGLILNGRAPINNCFDGAEVLPCEAEGEGSTGLYGGTDSADSSGVIKYVRVEYGGARITDENELNGVAFQGVGSGTEVDYLQVHMGADDGVEFFGGTVNAKHLVISGADDDSIDWTDGWTGQLQFAVVLQATDGGDNGIEADNNKNATTATPRSAPVLSHVSLFGQPDSEKSDLGVLLREGTAGELHNVLVAGWNEYCLSVDGDDSRALAASGALAIANSYVDCADGKEYADSVVEAWFTGGTGNRAGDALVSGAFDFSAPDFLPAGGSPVLSGGSAPSGSFFEAASHVGAFGTTDWTAGWTSFDAE